MQNFKSYNWSEESAWSAVCNNSENLGHYYSPIKDYIEPTGSKMIAGKCDLGNTAKILVKDEKDDGFWIAGGTYDLCGSESPLANIRFSKSFLLPLRNSVGWFVL